MKTGQLQIAPWARAEQRRKARAEWRMVFFANVRAVLALLFFATVMVFVYNHRVEIADTTTIGLSRALQKPAAVSDQLQQNALNHEKEVDQINPSSVQSTGSAASQ